MNSAYYAIPIEVGLKVEVRDFILVKLKSDLYMQNNFKLNIKRINRWWYSVYFADICKHSEETLRTSEITYCLKCGLRI